MTSPKPVNGLAALILEYRESLKDRKALQKEINAFMRGHDAKLKAAREAAMQSDDDGWTVVTRGAKNKSTDPDSGITVSAASKAATQENKSAGPKPAMDFYRFQHREARRNELMDLQKRFEEDKKRIARLKSTRKFRPY